jgi:IS30 family transposase
MDAIREEAFALLRDGVSLSQTCRKLGICRDTLQRWTKVAGMTMRYGNSGGLEEPQAAPQGQGWVDERGHLTHAARVLIQIRLADQKRPAQIAAELGVHRATVCREIARNRGTRPGGRYRAERAHLQALARRRRPKPQRLAPGTPVRLAVVAGLNNRFSPEQISADLRLRFPDRDDMRVSHETIYQALYLQGKGALRHELTVEKALRSGRQSRRPKSRLPSRGNRSWIGSEAHITQRPAEAADRAVPGHWEGDLVIGAGGKSAVITLVERSTRYALLRRLPLTHDAPTVTAALTEMISSLPDSLRRSLTWDQGVEMAAHAQFTVATNCPVYFCDPHSPWQRGTNENTNGLVRDIHPKGTDFTQLTDAEIAETERLLNIRPRKTLDWQTPATMLDELLAVASTA